MQQSPQGDSQPSESPREPVSRTNRCGGGLVRDGFLADVVLHTPSVVSMDTDVVGFLALTDRRLAGSLAVRTRDRAAWVTVNRDSLRGALVVEDGARRWRDSTWFDVVVIVSIVAAGTVVAGLLNDYEAGEPGADRVYSYVSEPVPYPVRIPGCDAVEPPSEPKRLTFATVGPQGYDDPRYPWFSGAKAAAMTEAAVDALPDSVELVFASPSQSLQFEPITDVDPSAFPQEEDADLFNGSTNARGSLVRDGHVGTVTVDVQAWDRPVLPCVAGGRWIDATPARTARCSTRWIPGTRSTVYALSNAGSLRTFPTALGSWLRPATPTTPTRGRAAGTAGRSR